MDAGAYEAEGRGFFYPVGHDAGDPTSQGLDWAEPVGASRVVDCRSTVAILLVVQVQGNGLGLF
jgi:hypothetical protein